MAINVLVHVVFASAIARDTGKMGKLGRAPYLVSGLPGHLPHWSEVFLLQDYIVHALLHLRTRQW